MQASSANGMLEIQKLAFIHFSYTQLFSCQPHSLQTSLNNPDREMLAGQMFKHAKIRPRKTPGTDRQQAWAAVIL